VRPPVKCHGGKAHLRHWIIPFLPPHRIHCEPFGGAASVLLNKPSEPVKVYGDLEPNLVAVMTVIRDRRRELYDRLESLNYNRDIYFRH
jgi:DNA adenine methylase